MRLATLVLGVLALGCSRSTPASGSARVLVKQDTGLTLGQAIQRQWERYPYDPGITPHLNFFYEDCKQCRGLGGFPLNEGRTDSRLALCSICKGTGTTPIEPGLPFPPKEPILPRKPRSLNL